jgi:phosphoenolpyruvate---glycerone phosphotransferase subunit DhaL
MSQLFFCRRPDQIMLTNLGSRDIILVIQRLSDHIYLNVDYLTKLDADIGDGDHGTNLARGFGEVKARISELGKMDDIGSILQQTGTILISSIGGASGPLYGTAFRRAGKVVKGKNTIDVNDLAEMLEAAEQGIVSIGGVRVGDKTMLDALDPAAKAARAAARSGEKDIVRSFEMIASAAKEGLEKTKSLVATKGRAMYLGDRSLGKYDVGAASLTVMIESTLDTVLKIDQEKPHN